MNRIRVFLADPLNPVALVAGLFWGFVALVWRPIGDYGVETDFYGDFVHYAREWMAGEPSPMNGFRGPFYYLLIGVLGTVSGGHWFLMGKLLSVVSAAVAVRLTGGLLRHLWNPGVGLGGAIFLAGSPIFVQYAFRACTDVFFLAVFVGTLHLLFRGAEAGEADGGSGGGWWKTWAAAGVLTGIAWLTRYNGAVLLPAGWIVALVAVTPLSRGIRSALVYTGTWAVLAAPWALYLLARTGDPLWNNAHQNIAIGVFTDNPALAQGGKFMSEVGFASVDEIIRVDPARFLKRVFENSFDYFLRDVRILVETGWAIPSLLGFGVGLRRLSGRSRIAFLLVGLLIYSGFLPVFYSERFKIPLLLWWGLGMGLLLDFLVPHVRSWVRRLPSRSGGGGRAQRRRRKRGKGGKEAETRKPAIPGFDPSWILVGALVAAAGYINVRQVRDALDPRSNKACPTEILKVADKARRAGAAIGPTTPIAARKPHIGHYLNAPVVPLPAGSIREFRESGAHYILVSGIEVNQHPELATFLYPRPGIRIPEGLRVVAKELVRLGGINRAATLYAIENPLPFTPRPPRIYERRRPVIEGLDRINTLRLQLARWYRRNLPSSPVESVLDAIPERYADHPEVLQLRGDVILRRSPEEAFGLYERAAGGRPRDSALRLRLAGAAFLDSNPDWRRYLAAVPEVASRDSVLRTTDFFRSLALDGVASGEYPPTIAPLAACLEGNPRDPSCLKMMAAAMYDLKRWEEAKGFLDRYLALVPADTGMKELRGRVETAIRKQAAGGSP